MKAFPRYLVPIFLILALLAAGCGPNVAPIMVSSTGAGDAIVAGTAATAATDGADTAQTASAGMPTADKIRAEMEERIEVSHTGGHAAHMAQTAPATSADGEADVVFTLKTSMDHGLSYVGVGGEIDGVVNPTLYVPTGATVKIELINGDGMEHDLASPDLGFASEHVAAKDQRTTVVFTADQEGQFAYFCTLPGHRAAGMEGLIVVGEGQAPAAATGADIVRDPTDLPGPIGDREPQTVRYELETVELEGQLADGTTYTYWTFNGKVPGPMMRVRVGDTVEVTVKNAASSTMAHSIDLHAVTGPGGGATLTQVPPGEERVFTFKALNPGLYVYHCATPMHAHHITNGMYGLILVEPEGGLPAVDREFYVMQGELYTQDKFGAKGHQEFSEEKLLDEAPEYYVFNGAAGALTTDEHAMRANVGETVRIFFGVGGPNATSSIHLIGEIFDRVYHEASLTSPPLTDVQTTSVPPGGATMLEFGLDVPGRYILVDHALSRMERGLVGFLYAEGPDAPEIYREGLAGE